MKYLLVLLVILVAAWVLMGRRRGAGDRPTGTGSAAAGKDKSKDKKAAQQDKPLEMVTCSHCGLHLPQTESVRSAQGANFCSDAHRLAGPR